MGNSSSSCFKPVPEHPPFSWPRDRPGRAEAIAEIKRQRRLGGHPDDLEIAEKFSVSSDTHTQPADVPAPSTTAPSGSAEAAGSETQKEIESQPGLTMDSESIENIPVLITSRPAVNVETVGAGTAQRSRTEVCTESKVDLYTDSGKGAKAFASKPNASSVRAEKTTRAEESTAAKHGETRSGLAPATEKIEAAIEDVERDPDSVQVEERTHQEAVDPAGKAAIGTKVDEQADSPQSLKAETNTPSEAAGEDNKIQAAGDIDDSKDGETPLAVGGTGVISIAGASTAAMLVTKLKSNTEGSKTNRTAVEDSAAQHAEAAGAGLAADNGVAASIVSVNEWTEDSGSVEGARAVTPPAAATERIEFEPAGEAADSIDAENSTQRTRAVIGAGVGSIAAAAVVAVAVTEKKEKAVSKAPSAPVENPVIANVEATVAEPTHDHGKSASAIRVSESKDDLKHLIEAKEKMPPAGVAEKSETKTADSIAESKDGEKAMPKPSAVVGAGIGSVPAASMEALTVLERKTNVEVSEAKLEAQSLAVQTSGSQRDETTGADTTGDHWKTALAVQVGDRKDDLNPLKEMKGETSLVAAGQESEPQSVGAVVDGKDVEKYVPEANAVVGRPTGSAAVVSAIAREKSKGEVSKEPAESKSGADDILTSQKSDAAVADPISKSNERKDDVEALNVGRGEKPSTAAILESESERAGEVADSKDVRKSTTKAGAVIGAGVGSVVAVAVAAVAVAEKKEKAASEAQSAAVETPAILKAETTAADPTGGHGTTAPAVKVSELKDDPKILKEAKEAKEEAASVESVSEPGKEAADSRDGKKSNTKTGAVVGAGVGSTAAATVAAAAGAEKKEKAASNAQSAADENLTVAKAEATAADPTGGHGTAAPAVNASELKDVSKVLNEAREETASGESLSEPADEAAESKEGKESSTKAGTVSVAGVGSTGAAAVAALAVTEKKEKSASKAQSAAVKNPTIPKAETTAKPTGGHGTAAPAVKVSELEDFPKHLRGAKEEKPSVSAPEKSKTKAAGVGVESKAGKITTPKVSVIGGAGAGSFAAASLGALAVLERKANVKASEAKSVAIETSTSQKDGATAAGPTGDHGKTARAIKACELTEDLKLQKEVNRDKPTAVVAKECETEGAGDVVKGMAGEKSVPKAGAVVDIVQSKAGNKSMPNAGSALNAGAGSVGGSRVAALEDLETKESKVKVDASEAKLVAVETTASPKDDTTAADPVDNHGKTALSDCFSVSKLVLLKQPSKSTEPEQPMSSATSVLDDGMASGSIGTIVAGPAPRSARSQGPADPAFYEGLVEEFLEKALAGKPKSDKVASKESKKQG
jgi:hypothetical protein